MRKVSFILFIAIINFSHDSSGNNQSNIISDFKGNKNMEIATFAAGCFWCVEAIFENLEGVEKVTSGYSGGKSKNPAYSMVTTGLTGHAEAVQIEYDADKITYEELLQVFWATHDPTTLNRQGADVGTQYRSVIFYHNEDQKNIAEQFKKALDESGTFDNPIVTEIVPFEKFYTAEEYHQNYYQLNAAQPYCRLVIAPKLEKFRKVFANKLKRDPAN